jgi:hypothetical protein
VNRDDGLGPYTYCKRGRSRCDDQQCDCVDTSRYRAMYHMTRERRGWDLGPHPYRMVLWLALCVALGATLGLAIVVVVYEGGVQ